MIKLIFLDELVSITQINCEDTISFTIFLDFKLQTYVCNVCHDLLMMSTNLDNINILKII